MNIEAYLDIKNSIEYKLSWIDYNEISKNTASNKLGDGMYLIASNFNDALRNALDNNSEYRLSLFSGSYSIISQIIRIFV